MEGTGEFSSSEPLCVFFYTHTKHNASLVVSGKTELLYHLLCRCVLPVTAGGLEVDVVFVDTDYNLDMLRLVSILDNRLNSGILYMHTPTHTLTLWKALQGMSP